MSEENLHDDPRLVGIDRTNPLAVYNALGGRDPFEDKNFDIEAYISLPIGQRLLTEEELASLRKEDRRPIPEKSEDPYYLNYYCGTVSEGNGGVSAFDYNWDPKEKKPVYDKQIPYGIVYAVKRVKGPNAKAKADREWQNMMNWGRQLSEESRDIKAGKIITE